MRFINNRHRYSQWDGSQGDHLKAEDVLGEISDDLMAYGDVKWAMRNLFYRGMKVPKGGFKQGLRDMMRQLRDQKRKQLDRFDLSSVMRGIEKQLDEILQLERDTIDQWRNRPQDQASDELVKDIADQAAETLDQLPESTAGKMRELEDYEFLNPEAQKKYLELLNKLREAVTESFFKDVQNMVKNISAGDLERMKEMLKRLNELINMKMADLDGGFDEFMKEFGDMFGDNPPKSLDELLEQMRQQMAASQALMNSLSSAQRNELQSLMSEAFGDAELQSELERLVSGMDFLDPRGGRYLFRGDEDIDLQAALQLMDELRQTDELISQIQRAERAANLDLVDRDMLKALLGDESAESLDDMKELMKALEEAGYVRSTGDDKWELTPRGSRMIGYRALGEIYARLRRQNLGNHPIPEEGRFGERLEQTKEYEFGDPMHLHLPRTLRNAIDRGGPVTPIKLREEDFEIYRSEMISSTATAMLIDLSWSMVLRDAFQAAKKVALALHHLITAQFPKDSFYIIGFAAYARELKPKDLPLLHWDEYVLGTNMQHALLLAERMLAKHNVGTKQIIMISDGEPTAHLENGHAQFAYPPTDETIRATYRAVRHCTQKGIAINTFMLDRSRYLKQFMDAIAKINGGRVFYTSPDRLGEYILVDYVKRKRSHISRVA